MAVPESLAGKNAMADPLPATAGPGERNSRPVVEISEGFVYAFLFAVFFLAFIFVPYWRLAPERWQQICLAASTTGIGIMWAIWSAGPTRLRLARRDVFWFLVIGAALWVISRKALAAGIPWRGDEDLHILQTLDCARYIVQRWAPSLAVAGVMIFLFLAWRAERLAPWLLIVSCLLSVGAAAGIGFEGAPLQNIARYPYFGKILSAAALIPFRPFSSDYPPEWMLRTTPFVAATAVAWLPMTWFRGQRSRSNPAPWEYCGIGLALVIGTLPLILYYSSLLYLEMPAVFLMTVVCFAAAELLESPPEQLRAQPAWYALLLIGFVKETALPFLLVFLIVRYAVQSRRILRAENKRRAIGEEVKIGVCVALPLLLYLAYRAFCARVRSFEPHPANLTDWRLYGVLARAYAQQIGPVLLMSAAGFALLAAWARPRRWSTLVFLVAALAAQNALHLVDFKNYVGYSRFSLFSAPMLLVPACLALDWTARRSRWVTGLLLAALLAGNLWLCPIEHDGSRKPGWGDPDPWHSVTDWSYPYRDVCRYLNTHHIGKGVAFVFQEYYYPVEYYLDSRTRFDVIARKDQWARFLETPVSRRPTVVVYHWRRRALPEALGECGYMVEKVFENDAGNKLVLLTRRATGEEPS